MYLLDYFNKIILFSYLKKGNISFTIFEISLSLLGVARRGIDVTLQGKSILSLENLSVAEIERILQVATQMKNIVVSQNKKLEVLKGKSIATLFFEASTRTRSSFELAAKYLGADVVNISKTGSSMTKGESVRDTVLTLSAMGVDALVIRDSSEGAAIFASKAESPKIKVPPVINAGDGAHAHPTQGLLDLFTIQEAGIPFKGMKYVILGDILHSRVARSDIVGFSKLGADVYIYGPKTLVPKELESLGCTVANSMEEALTGADAINVLRIQMERAAAGFFPSLAEYSALFGLNKDRLGWVKPHAIVMHPGPMNRGVEITQDLAYDNRSWIQQEVQHGVAVRMALLYLILAEGKDFEIHN